MSICVVEKLSHGFGGRIIFEDVSFRLNKGEHVGLVGANGEGKSTFMKMLTRNLEPDEGKIIWSNRVKVGYLDQHTVLAKGMCIRDVLRSAFDDLVVLEKEIEEAYNKMCDCDEETMNELLEFVGEAQDTLEHRDYYLIDSKIEEVARAIGIDDYGLEVYRSDFPVMTYIMKKNEVELLIGHDYSRWLWIKDPVLGWRETFDPLDNNCYGDLCNKIEEFTKTIKI